MRRIHLICATWIVATAAAAAAQGAAQSPALPTVDQILDKYVTAIGGRAALEKITSTRARGTVEIAELKVTGTVEITQKVPNKSLQAIELAGMGVQREGFDGTVGWAEDPQNGVRDKTGPELAEGRRLSLFPRELKLKEAYPTMTVTGREPVNGRDAIVVVATPAEGTPVRLFFDAESGLLVRSMATREGPEGQIQTDATYEDYRVTDGVKRAHVIRQINPKFTVVVRLTELVNNATIDDVVFRKPGKHLSFDVHPPDVALDLK